MWINSIVEEWLMTGHNGFLAAVLIFNREAAVAFEIATSIKKPEDRWLALSRCQPV